ncbi:MAG TPA: VWA domain-containing protein [Vicinamibacterales bacterium]|nr:VWA domain-containing protein [Vicinamibacterales bacterium]
MTKLGRSAVTCAAACFGLAVGVDAQQTQAQRPTFKSGTQLVEVDVRVFDKSGRFVTTLAPEDFEIKEDGAVQPITTATLVGGAPEPPNPGTPNPGTPNRTTEPPNLRTPEPSPPSSTVIFLFDTVHLSPGGLNRSRAAVTEFVRDRMQGGDLAGVVANGTMVGNRMTTDREELQRDLDSLKMPGDTAAIQRTMKFEVPRFADEYEAYMIAERDDPDALGHAVRRGCEDDPQLCNNMEALVKSKAQMIDGQLHDGARLTVMAIRALSRGLARIAGTKSVVFVSEGFMLWHVQDELRDAIGEANRAGAHVYAIDVRGLDKGHASDLLFTKLPDRPDDLMKFDEQVDGPSSLAVDTGGMFIQNENNLGGALDTIQRDAATYYVIGYTPTNQTFDGRYRAISVTVKRPGMKVRARRGYLAIDPAKLLKPTPIDTAPSSTAPAATSAPSRTVAPAPTAESAPAPLETVVRTRISDGGLVKGLKGNDEGIRDDAASLGWAAYQEGDVEGAKAQLLKAAAKPDAHPWVHYVLGLCHYALSEYDAAAASFERVRTAAPEFEPVYFNLTDAYQVQNKLGEAIAVLDAASKRWPKDSEIYDAKGVIQIHESALAGAIASFERATKLAPKDPLGFFNLASAHHAAALRLRELSANRQARLQQTQEDVRLEQSSNGGGLPGMAWFHRNSAIQAYRHVIALKGLYVDDAKKGLAALQAR